MIRGKMFRKGEMKNQISFVITFMWLDGTNMFYFKRPRGVLGLCLFTKKSLASDAVSFSMFQQIVKHKNKNK